MPIRITIIGDYDPASETHRFTDAALQHSLKRKRLTATTEWVHSRDISLSILAESDGIWIGPGGPYQAENARNVYDAIACARLNKIPCLGTCGGFQHMVVEYARNVVGIAGAEHEEYVEDGAQGPGGTVAAEGSAGPLVISRLACSLRGREMNLTFVKGSKAAIGQDAKGTEKYYCNFGVNPEYVPMLSSGPFRITASDAEGKIRAMELESHPFYVGTLYLPQATSTASSPRSLINAFVDAARIHFVTVRTPAMAAALNRDEALQILRDHQPLPPDSVVDDITLERFGLASAYFKSHPDPACIPLFLGSFANDTESNGRGTYAQINFSAMGFTPSQMLPFLLFKLGHGSENAKNHALEIAASFPHPSLMGPATRFLQQGTEDQQCSAAYLLSCIGSPEARRTLQSARATIHDPAVREAIDEALSNFDA